MSRITYFSITFVALLMGIMITFQLRSTSAEDSVFPNNRERELALEKKQLVTDLLLLQEEAADLSAKLNEAGAGGNKADYALEQELAKVKRYAGLAPVIGPGVEVLMESKPGNAGTDAAPGLKEVTDEHILRVVNELSGGGAEAIAVNDQRILAVSEIRLAGSHINVNMNPLSPPYRVAAIGNAAELESRLEIKNGFVEYLRESGISVNVQRKDHVMVPAFTGMVDFEYAKPVQMVTGKAPAA